MTGHVPLWCKSNHSFLEGASHPEELVETAHRLGLPALALTDRDGVYGIVRAHTRARELGLPLLIGAQVTLGMLSIQARDFEQSAKWFLRAAEAGDAEAMTNLAALYFRGLGVERDAARGLDWFARAAAEGDPANQLRLGQLYLDGAGGAPEIGPGLRWIRRAANQGYVEAQIRLGSIHAEGGVVEKDLVRAYMWFHLASMMGNEQAGKVLTGLAREMTAAEIAAAKRLADAWQPGSTAPAPTP